MSKQGSSETDRKYTTLARNLSDDDLLQHIRQKETYGACPNGGGSDCQWAVIDLDADDQKAIVGQVSTAFTAAEGMGLSQQHILVETHDGKRCHLCVSFTYPIDKHIAQRFLESLLPPQPGVEHFAASRNCVRLPGGHHWGTDLSPAFWLPNRGFVNKDLYEALRLLNPVQTRMVLELARSHGWQETTTILRQERPHFNIVQVATGLGLRRQNGRWFCPKHHDGEVPNLELYPETETFNCFSAQCKWNGDVFDLVSQVHSCSVKDAYRWLCVHYKVDQNRLQYPMQPPVSLRERNLAVLAQNRAVQRFVNPYGQLIYDFMMRKQDAIGRDCFFVSFEDIRAATSISFNAVRYAVDRLRFARLVKSWPVAPDGCTDRCTGRRGLARWYQPVEVTLELLVGSERRIKEDYRGRDGLRRNMAAEDHAFLLDRTLSVVGRGHAFITIRDVQNGLCLSRGRCVALLDCLTEIGHLKKATGGPRNEQEWSLTSRDPPVSRSCTMSSTAVTAPPFRAVHHFVANREAAGECASGT